MSLSVCRPAIGTYSSSVSLLGAVKASLVPLVAKPTPFQRSLLYQNVRGYADKASIQNTQSVTLQTIGVASFDYIPPTGENVPSITENPKLRWVAVQRKVFWTIRMLIRLGMSKFRYKLPLHFNEWKSRAEELYIDLNKGFAAMNQSEINKCSTLFVQTSLKDRMSNMDKNWIYNWTLKEHISKTKLVDLSPLDLGDNSPVRYIQLIYRFHTLQKLEFKYKKNKFAKREPQIRNVLDYIVYAYDQKTDEMKIIGSVFESSLSDSLPIQSTNRRTILNSMKEKGDIFRKRPSSPNYV
ncbi:MBA1-like protein-domain-containing protein [Dipodascopsis uninucleata]